MKFAKLLVHKEPSSFLCRFWYGHFIIPKKRLLVKLRIANHAEGVYIIRNVLRYIISP